MARIVLATFGSLGDLHPLLALAFELRRRGHTATIATSELYRAKVTGLGFGFAPLRPELSVLDPALVRRIMDGVRGFRFLVRETMIPAVREMLADLSRATSAADLLISNELVYAAPLLAEQTGLRWVSYALAPMSYFSTHDPCVPPISLGGDWRRALPPFAVRAANACAAGLTHSWWRPIRELRRELGLPPGENPFFKGKHSPRLDLALFSAVLQAPQPDWPASTVQPGCCFFDEEETAPALPAAVAGFLAAGAPPIVFTLGSAAVFAAENFYADSAAAARILGRRALLLLGPNPPPPDLPPSILAWDYLPFARILPHAAAIVHQGGVGTTSQALRAGRPMLVMPFGYDQFDNAVRVTRLGLAQVISRRRYTARRAAARLAALLDTPGPTQAAAAVATRVRAEGGPVAACDALEQSLR